MRQEPKDLVNGETRVHLEIRGNVSKCIGDSGRRISDCQNRLAEEGAAARLVRVSAIPGCSWLPEVSLVPVVASGSVAGRLRSGRKAGRDRKGPITATCTGRTVNR